MNDIFNIINHSDQIIYHGSYEQRQIIAYIQNVCNIDLAPFVPSKLNISGWNLGFVRNYALIYSKLMNFKKVLFIDDDIIVPSDKLIHAIFDLLSSYNIVGANISGLPDYSIIEYLIAKLGIKPSHPDNIVSGGFMAFNLDEVSSEFFINIYNEDWIWQIMHCNLKSTKYGEVYQIPTNIFNNYNRILGKARWQSIGEIAVDGLLLAKKEDCIDWNRLFNQRFWRQVIELNSKELEKTLLLTRNNTESLNKLEYDLLKKVIQYYKQIKPYLFINIFRKYNILRNNWLILLKKLNNCCYLVK